MMAGYRIFISHGWADLWVAQQIERRARELGADTFIDAYDIDKGSQIEDAVFAALPKCDEFVVLFTPWSVERNWLWSELGAARALGKHIVPVLYNLTLDDIDKNHGGTVILRNRNIVEINQLEDYFVRLKVRIGGK